MDDASTNAAAIELPRPQRIDFRCLFNRELLALGAGRFNGPLHGTSWDKGLCHDIRRPRGMRLWRAGARRNSGGSEIPLSSITQRGSHQLLPLTLFLGLALHAWFVISVDGA